MAIFKSYASLPEGIFLINPLEAIQNIKLWVPDFPTWSFLDLPGTGDTFLRPKKPEQSWHLAGTFRCWVAKLG